MNDITPNRQISDPEIEQAVITYLARGAFTEPRLTEEHFHHPGCATIFRVVDKMWREGVPVDYLTVWTRLRDAELMEADIFYGLIDERAMIHGISADSFRHLCQSLDLYRLDREKHRILVGDHDLHVTRAKLEKLTPAFDDKANLLSLRDMMSEWLIVMDDRSSGKKTRAIKTGIRTLDNVTRGLEPARLIVVAARPNVGKTSLLFQFVIEACKQNAAVALFSLEMTRMQVADRLMSQVSGVPGDIIRKPMDKFSDDAKKLAKGLQEINGYRLHIDDDSELTVPRLRERVLRMKEAPDLIVVDYLQIMRPAQKSESRQIDVGEMSRALKSLSKQLDVPVLVAAQLNRGPENSGAKLRRPRLSDLRESGSIEAETDVVMFLHEVNEIVEEEDSDQVREMELIVGKNRDGAKNVLIKVDFDPTTTTFRQADKNF